MVDPFEEPSSLAMHVVRRVLAAACGRPIELMASEGVRNRRAEQFSRLRLRVVGWIRPNREGRLE
jgi:hypothetical protein